MSRDAATQARHDVIPAQILGLIFFIACVVFSAIGLIALTTYLDVGSNPQVPMLAAQRPLNPEPIERAVFVLLAALAPISLVIAAKFLRPFNPIPLASGLMCISSDLI